MHDKQFISEIRERHKLSSKHYEYTASEAKNLYDRHQAGIKYNEEQIEVFREQMSEESSWKEKKKLNKKIINLQRANRREVVFGGRYLLKMICKHPDEAKYKDEFKDKRTLPVYFYGETARKGNRFFDLSQLSEGLVLLKYEGTDIEIPIELKYISKMDALLLKQLETLAMSKKIPVSIMLTDKEIGIIYDETEIHGTKFDRRGFYKTIKHIADGDERKQLLKESLQEFEKMILADKNKNRYFSVDINPDGIGYSILQKRSDSPKGDFIVLDKKYFNFKFINDHSTANKRKYELSIAVKQMFNQLSHWNCAYFVCEDLDKIPTGDHGNKKSNKLINNLWNRKLLKQLFTKYCNIRGIKLIPVIPAYSSFIGNINYEAYDPIAAAIEIGRRGIVKYIKGGSIFPEFCISNIVNGLTKRFANNKLFAKKIYDKIYTCKTWRDLYRLFSTAKMSVRRKLSDNKFDFSVKYLKNVKSGVEIFSFL